MIRDFRSWVQNPRRQKALRTRQVVERGVREYFDSQGFLEVRTPLLVTSPGMEPHIRPYLVDGGSYLPTSPEFAMKKLLAGGLQKIYQLAPVFRNEPKSSTHHPEFTMLEWYSVGDGLDRIQKNCEELVVGIASKLSCAIDFSTPWPRFKVRDLFLEHAGVDLVRSHTFEALSREAQRLGIRADFSRQDLTWDDLYFEIWLNRIEPKLPGNRPVFVEDYPASQAALAKTRQDPDGSVWAERFELYIGGLELANAFHELTDPVEQRIRFEKDMALREKTYGSGFPKSPIDEEFLSALQSGLPACSGIALGVDRLVMLLADEPDIRYTLWLESASEPPAI